MSAFAIRAERAGKEYVIGDGSTGRYRTIRESLSNSISSAFRGRRASRERPSASRRSTLWAMRDVSFEIRPGEVIGVVGRNGAGKSTLLKVLSRITAPTEGHIDLVGRVGSLLEVGTGFHPELTGRENVYLNGAILGMSRAEIRGKFDEIVSFAEVEKFLDTPVKRYSSGMYTRLAFAVAAHLEPEILVVDEVLAVGDAAFQKRCLGKMSEVASQGRTVLFVSHNMGAVAALCSRVIWLDAGRVRLDGEPRSTISRYITETTETLAGRLDVAHARRSPYWGGQVKITGVTINDGRPVAHGDPIVVRLEYECRSQITGASFSYGFSSFEGTRLLTVDTDGFGERFELVIGDGYIDMSLESLPLSPGDFLLDIGSRSGDHSSLDYLPGCATVSVVPGARTPAHFTGGTVCVRLGAASSGPKRKDNLVEIGP